MACGNETDIYSMFNGGYTNRASGCISTNRHWELHRKKRNVGNKCLRGKSVTEFFYIIKPVEVALLGYTLPHNVGCVRMHSVHAIDAKKNGA